MSSSAFDDAALVLLGHGTTLNAASATPVYEQAAEWRRRGGFGEVREAFWKQEPRVQEVLGTVTASRVFVVPMFISEGYFTQVVIPRGLGFAEAGQGSLGRVRRLEHQTLYYCLPVGTHERMTEVVLARAQGVLERFPFPRVPRVGEVTLFLAGHGTRQNENSRQAVERQVERVKALSIYADVRAIYLEEDPPISACYTLAKTRNVVVVPYFMSGGLHVQEDIPRLLGEPEALVRERKAKGLPPWRNPTERHGKRLWYGESVGTAPQVADVVLARVREALC